MGKKDGVIRFANRAAERIFNRSVGELFGQPFGFPILGKEIEEIEVPLRGKESRVAEMSSSGIDWMGERCLLISIRNITALII